MDDPLSTFQRLLSRVPFAVGSGNELDAELLPVGMPTGWVDLTVTHPFGDPVTLVNALELVTLATTQGPPCSVMGDANCDDVVDGRVC